ncbi:MAG TPA: aminoacyl-tRNA hydrolase [Acidimicrobiales bacterium]|nr:aminoacyl-tRNA hydrolase [Acidimicrobiales bacterium]
MVGGPRRGTSADWVVLGLGNPGAEFRHTRHNLGAEVVETLAGRWGQRLRSERGTRATVTQARLGGVSVVLAVPQTYMNDSGLAAAALVRRFGPLPVDHVVVVHDELDLPVGRVKVKVGGGTAGHNGLRSINAHLHDDAYVRVRVGIGKPPGRRLGVDHVLSAGDKGEREALSVAVETAADAVQTIVEQGAEAAMTRFNAEPV